MKSDTEVKRQTGEYERSTYMQLLEDVYFSLQKLHYPRYDLFGHVNSDPLSQICSVVFKFSSLKLHDKYPKSPGNIVTSITTARPFP